MREPLHFVSSNKKFELCIPGELLDQITVRCMLAGSSETGGVLVGKYSDDRHTAQVTAVSDSPKDSIGDCTSFTRGIKGLGGWLRHLWRRKSQYYLGEWHFHPMAGSQPSMLDDRSMLDIAKARVYRCPEPILFIIGGGERRGWFFHAQVTTSDGKVVLLSRRESG
jgi:integrative and conjugative element protein (TIGR02256 family)